MVPPFGTDLNQNGLDARQLATSEPQSLIRTPPYVSVIQTPPFPHDHDHRPSISTSLVSNWLRCTDRYIAKNGTSRGSDVVSIYIYTR